MRLTTDSNEMHFMREISKSGFSVVIRSYWESCTFDISCVRERAGGKWDQINSEEELPDDHEFNSMLEALEWAFSRILETPNANP